MNDIWSAKAQADSNAAKHQHQHDDPVGPAVCKQISLMRVGCASHLDDTRQRGIGVGYGSHVHRLGGQPNGLNADQRIHSRSKAAQEALPCRGHFTTIVALARCTSTRMSGAACGAKLCAGSSSVTGTNAFAFTFACD